MPQMTWRSVFTEKPACECFPTALSRTEGHPNIPLRQMDTQFVLIKETFSVRDTDDLYMHSTEWQSHTWPGAIHGYVTRNFPPLLSPHLSVSARRCPSVHWGSLGVEASGGAQRAWWPSTERLGLWSWFDLDGSNFGLDINITASPRPLNQLWIAYEFMMPAMKPLLFQFVLLSLRDWRLGAKVILGCLSCFSYFVAWGYF